LIKAGSFGLIAAERVAELVKGRSVVGKDPLPSATTPALESTGASAPHGLDRFPMLRATIRFGNAAALIAGLLAAVLTLWISWPSWGTAQIVLAAVLALGVAIGIRSYTELVRLIAELLIPD
jgi:hypothetical protein